MKPIRVNKYLAERGDASRREADKLIAAGKVLINGRVAKLGDKVSADDKVEIEANEAKKLSAKSYSYFAYSKPRGEETKERYRVPSRTVLDELFPIGRLDKDSEGLLIVTNDGRLTKKLIGPNAEQEKEYIVEVDKKIAGIDLKRMTEGMKIESEQLKPAKVKKLGENTFQIILTEGKKHQIRRMGAALGYQVRSLKRIRVGKIRLGQQTPGTFRRIKIEL